MSQPGWLVDHMKKNGKPVVKEQITIIAKGPLNPKTVENTMSAPISKSRLTGAGVDNVVQPAKMAGAVDEGEGVLSANAMQAIGSDTFLNLTRQAEAGKLDVNALRTALRMQPIQKFQTGSWGPVFKDPVSQSFGAGNPFQAIETQANKDYATLAPVQAAPASTFPALTTPGSITVPKQDTSGLSPINTTTGLTTTAPAPTGFNFSASDQATAAADATNKQQYAAPASNVAPVSIQAPAVAPPAPAAFNFAPADQAAAAADAASKSVQESTARTAATVPSTGSTPAASRWDTILNQSVNRTQGLAEGISPIYSSMANQALRNYDTRTANDIAKTEMNLATRSDMPENLKGSLLAQAASGARSGRSELIANMSADARNRQQAANTELANIATTQKSAEQTKANQDRDFVESQRRFGITQDQWQKSFDSGEIHWNDQKQQWEQTFARDTAQQTRANTLDDVKTLMSMGVTENIDAITSKLAGLGITVNPSAILAADKGKKFTDAMSTFTTLLATPGMTYENAVQSLKASGQYDTIASAFGGASGQWTGDPAANPITKATTDPKTLTNDDVNWLIDNNYTLTGAPAGGSSGIKTLWDSSKTAANPTDAAWAQYSGSDWFKGQTPEKQAQLKAVWDQVMSGPSDQYNFTQDANGQWIVTPKTTAELTGGFTGDPNAVSTWDLLKDPKNANYDSALTAVVDNLTNTGDYSKLNALAADDPVKKAITDKLTAKATAWSGTSSQTATRDQNIKNSTFDVPLKKDQYVTIGGKIYVVDSDTQTEQRNYHVDNWLGSSDVKYNVQTVKLKDPSTGQVITVSTDKNQANGSEKTIDKLTTENTIAPETTKLNSLDPAGADFNTQVESIYKKYSNDGVALLKSMDPAHKKAAGAYLLSKYPLIKPWLQGIGLL